MALLDKVSQTGVNSRLESFCDGVFSFALTLLVVNLVTPVAGEVNTMSGFWKAMVKLIPELLCFLLSFAIIVITWNGHHSTMKLVEKCSPQFIRANALLLMTIVLLPFATNLMAEFLFTEIAGPAVLVFSLLTMFSNLSWMNFYRTALPLTYADDKPAMEALISQSKIGFLLYLSCVLAALWFPLVTACAQVVIWFLWLFHDRVADQQLGDVPDVSSH